MTSNTNGFYEYLPKGYNPSASQTYPLIVFLHGLGECGDGSPSQLPRVLNAGTPRYCGYNMFPDSFIVNGQSYKFIVISPQFVGWPSADQVSAILDYTIDHYKVDVNRIYLTGLSMGGGITWDFTGWNTTNANRVAAIVPVCGANYPWAPYMQNVAAANVAVWATHNDQDYTANVQLTIDNTNYINYAPTPPNPLAKRTIFNAVGHDAWTRTYDLNFKENGKNIYEWMLQYRRYFGVTLPVTGLELNAAKRDARSVVLNWKTITEVNNRGFEIERSSDGNSYAKIGFVSAAGVNGNGADYTFLDATPLNRKNYYRLKQVDIENKFKYSTVRFVDFDKDKSLTIYPNPVVDVLNINTTGYSFLNAQLRVFDMSGKVVLQQTSVGNTNITVPAQQLPKGAYTGEIIDGNVPVRFRFIKQ